MIYNIGKIDCIIRINGVDTPQNVWRVFRSSDYGGTWQPIPCVYFTQEDANKALFEYIEVSKF